MTRQAIIFILIVWPISILFSGICLGKLNYNIDFSSPVHTIGQIPTVDYSPATPSKINFGNPKVKESFGEMTEHPLVFDAEGGETKFFYDQIQLGMDQQTGIYYTSFDVLTRDLIGSENHFVAIYDLPLVHIISFMNTGTLNIFSRKNITFQDDMPMRFEIIFGISNNFAKVWINKQLVYDDKLRLFDDRNEPYSFRSLRFSHGLKYSGQQDTRSSVALDNIIVISGISDDYEIDIEDLAVIAEHWLDGIFSCD